ncbi:hypothetical protein D3C84_809620 [compost metagenome]
MKHHVLGQLIDQGVRQIDHRFLDVRLCQGDHLLAGSDDLPGLGHPRGDHRFVIGTQFNVVQLVLGLIDRRLGLVKRSLGGFQVSLRSVELRLGAHALIEQALLSPCSGLGIDQIRPDTRQIAFCGAQLVLLIGRIQRGKQGALFDFRADIDATAGDASRHPETDVAFITGLDAPREAAEVLLTQRFDLDRQHRAHRFRCCFLFRTGHQHHTGEHQ